MAVAISNQWAGTFSQPAAMGVTPPALQSVVVPLTPASSVGGGSGTPTAGNWLVTLIAMNESASAPGFTCGVGDDIHSFWRPGDETTSTWAVSSRAGLTRCSAWYTANTARVPGNVYVAPDGCFDALAVLVLEVSGLGAWDTVTGIVTSYAAAATSLPLSLGAPSGAALVIGAVAGDNTANGQAFAPGGWTALHTVTASNGTDHTSDAELTAAWITTSGSLSVSGSATSAVNLSGVLIGVLTSAPSPVPAGHDPNWPLLKCEAAFGAGFQTPQDQVTWTDLSSRLWSWSEETGVQFELGEIQATELNLELDNYDNMLASDNPASYFYTAAGGGWQPSSAFYDALVAGAAPLGWWKLADAAGSSTAADSSGNGHAGTATSVTFGNASEAVNGNTSASFASASSSHVLTTYNPALGSALTVEGWVNLNGLTQPTSFGRVIANSFSDSDSKGFQLYRNGSRAQFWIGNGSINGGVIGGTVPATGWTYLAGTYDGTTIRLYVNGVQAGSAAFTGSVPAGTATGIGIGYNPAYAGDFINGLIAECAVYGTALTASQVAARYTAGPGITGTPVRIRAAAGTLGGVTVNRWYVIQRNVEIWPQQVDPAYRRTIRGTATDVWSAASAASPTPYRGEVEQDSPYAWYPGDDATLAGGTLPSTMRNAATGNTNPLNIIISPNGTGPDTGYGTDGTSAGIYGYTTGVPVGLATYTVAQAQGWMFGDPPSGQQSSQSGNPVTASPGSAAWQQIGASGNTGSKGWLLSCNDAGFPPLSAGITVEGWFLFPYFGSQKEFSQSGIHVFAQEPYCPLTLLTLTTGSAPVALLQLDTSGHLSLVTYNGTTPTSHSVYTTSDLRTGGWFHVAATLTTSTWTVYLNGGLSATVSGSGTSMTSAWSWLVVNGDMGSTHGGGTPASIVHGANLSWAHVAVYPLQLPAWRIRAHYWSALTAFGQVPTPTGLGLQIVATTGGSSTLWPDGQQGTGTFGLSNNSFTFSALVVAQIGSYTSGPSAWTVGGSAGSSSALLGYVVCPSWSGLAPQYAVYTAASVGAETQASVTAGLGEVYTSGYGGSAAGAGIGHLSGGSGAAPPAAASSVGDTVAQRLERILGYGNLVSPARCIDPAALLVQAATDIGGQQSGQNLQNIAQSDGGLLFIDNLGNLTYWQRSHLASQYASPAWNLGPDGTTGQVPYYRETFSWLEDPQRVFNAILIQPFSPDGTNLADITPAQGAQVNASQAQYGAQPHQITSYLQSPSEQQAQANWIFEYFGTSQIRVEGVMVNAAPDPAAFPLVLGINVGDVVTCQNWQLGGGGATGTFRVSSIHREFAFGGDDAEDAARATVTLKLDFEPDSYWS